MILTEIQEYKTTTTNESSHHQGLQGLQGHLQKHKQSAFILKKEGVGKFSINSLNSLSTINTNSFLNNSNYNKKYLSSLQSIFPKKDSQQNVINNPLLLKPSSTVFGMKVDEEDKPEKLKNLKSFFPFLPEEVIKSNYSKIEVNEEEAKEKILLEYLNKEKERKLQLSDLVVKPANTQDSTRIISEYSNFKSRLSKKRFFTEEIELEVNKEEERNEEKVEKVEKKENEVKENKEISQNMMVEEDENIIKSNYGQSSNAQLANTTTTSNTAEIKEKEKERKNSDSNKINRIQIEEEEEADTAFQAEKKPNNQVQLVSSIFTTKNTMSNSPSNESRLLETKTKKFPEINFNDVNSFCHKLQKKKKMFHEFSINDESSPELTSSKPIKLTKDEISSKIKLFIQKFFELVRKEKEKTIKEEEESNNDEISLSASTTTEELFQFNFEKNYEFLFNLVLLSIIKGK